jgi:hypothetical protein
VPPALDSLILHMLDKSPGCRPTLGAIRDRLASLRAVAPCDEAMWPECELEIDIEIDFTGPTEPALPVPPRPLMRWTPPIGPAAASASIAAAIERCLDEAERARGDIRRGALTVSADLDACVTGEIAAPARPLH